MISKISRIIFLLIVTSTCGFSQQGKGFCSKEPTNIDLLKDYSALVSPKISPFTNSRNYFLYISKSMSIYSKDCKKWCIYNTIKNEIEIIDSIYSCNYNKIYFGFEEDSLFVFNTTNKEYYKIVYPQKTIDYNLDSGKIMAFNQVQKMRLIEKEFEFVINKKNDLAYFDINKGWTYIYLNNNNYNDSIVIKGNGTTQNESMIFWYSDTELIFVDGTFNEENFDFIHRPYIYDITEGKIINIESGDIIRFYDYINELVLIGTLEEPFKSAKLLKENGKFNLKIINSIFWEDINNIGSIYTIFRLKEDSYIFKAEAKTGRRDVNGFYYSKLVQCK